MSNLKQKIEKLTQLSNKPLKNLDETTEIFTMKDWRRLAMGLQGQIDSIANPEVIDLDSQCDGSNTVFDLGKMVKGVLFINNGGAILVKSDYTLNDNKSQITLTYAPTSGEELEAVVLT